MPVIFSMFLTIALLWLMVLFPTWMIFSVVARKDKSRKFKTLWILGIVAVWPLGSIAYAFFEAGSPIKKKLGFLQLALIFLFCAVYVVLAHQSHADAVESLPRVWAAVEANPPGIIRESLKEEVLMGLTTVDKELTFEPIYTFKGLNVVNLVWLLEIFLEDGLLTGKEAETWLQYLKERDVADPNKIKGILAEMMS